MKSTMVYEWGRNAYAVDAQTVGEAVERIAQREGFCPPGWLVDEARSLDSPLHPLFTWDDHEAATNWRTHEARRIINSLSVTVTIQDEVVRAPAFLSVGHRSETQQAGEGYRPVTVVTADPAFSQEALADALGRLRAIRKRYEALDALTPVWDAIDRVAS